MKSVLFGAQENKMTMKKLDFTKGKLVRLSEMFSTAATFLPEDKEPTVSASSYCVMLSDSKKVVLGSNLDTHRQVASLTKLMTALTVNHICKQYSVDMNATKVKTDNDSALMEGTSAGLKCGDELSIVDMLHGMLLPSGNDAATALANHFGKFLSCMYSSQQYQPLASRFDALKEYYDEHYKNDSVKLFMFVMNRMAKEIGIKDTHFENPTGLQHKKSYSTAYDMAVLSSAFASHPNLMAVVQKKNYHYSVYNNSEDIVKILVMRALLVTVVACLLSTGLAVKGVDVSQPFSSSTYTCMKNNGVAFSIIRGYCSFGGLDTHAVEGLNAARAAGLITDIYMFPCRGKSATTQVNEMMGGIPNNLFGMVWIDVETNPSTGCSWSGHDAASNCAFLQ
ncbi:unnamed protein product [Sphagnum balticum]